MLNKEREQQIINILKSADGFVTVKALCEALFASESSIRRDLKVLEKRGFVKRSHGGATAVTNFSNIVTFNQRTRENVYAKKEIAQKASALIKEGDVIFLDQSSTSFYLANEIINRSSLTVVTNNIEIMMLLSGSRVKVVSSGGFISGENRNCLVGSDSEETFRNIFADIAFFSVKALSFEGVVTDCSREEISVRNIMLKNAKKSVLLCDSTKFGDCATYKQCDLCDLNYLISDGDKAQQFKSFENVILL